MNTVFASSICMPKRDYKRRCTTFRCFDQIRPPSLFRRLAWYGQDRRSATLSWAADRLSGGRLMAYTKTVVCLANSRKTAGRCIAGKEWNDGNPGGWFRPVSSRTTHEISEEERRFQNGQDPKLLDIISIPCSQPQPAPYQGENHRIDPGYYWEKVGSLTWGDLEPYLDHPASLWANGESSYAFLNNRVQDGYTGGTSLYLVAVDSCAC